MAKEPRTTTDDRGRTDDVRTYVAYATPPPTTYVRTSPYAVRTDGRTDGGTVGK